MQEKELAEKKMFQCPVCKITFATKEEYEKHV